MMYITDSKIKYTILIHIVSIVHNRFFIIFKESVSILFPNKEIYAKWIIL
jgi:hypothetical protein